MPAMGPGPDVFRKIDRVFCTRRKLLFRGGVLALTPSLARPLQLFASPQTSGGATSTPEKRPLTLEARIKQIIVRQLGVEEKQVVPQARLKEDLDADSLDLVELLMACEEAFDIEISDEAVCTNPWKTVADVVHTVQAEISKKQSGPAPH